MEYQFNSKYQCEKDVLNTILVKPEGTSLKIFSENANWFLAVRRRLESLSTGSAIRGFLHKNQQEQTHHQFVVRKRKK